MVASISTRVLKLWTQVHKLLEVDGSRGNTESDSPFLVLEDITEATEMDRDLAELTEGEYLLSVPAYLWVRRRDKQRNFLLQNDFLSRE